MKLIILLISLISLKRTKHKSPELSDLNDLNDVQFLYDDDNIPIHHNTYSRTQNNYDDSHLQNDDDLPPQIPSFKRSTRSMIKRKNNIKGDFDVLRNQYIGEDQRGYIDPTKNILDPHGILQLRFKEAPKRDIFSTLQPYYYNIERPEKDSEKVRKEGLSNGVLLEGSQRTCNFETSNYSEFFMDLRHDT